MIKESNYFEIAAAVYLFCGYIVSIAMGYTHDLR